MLYLWRELHLEECQLDELWSFVHSKEANLAAAKRICQSYGDAWVWIAFAPLWRMVVAFVVGKRTQENANLLLQPVVSVSDGGIPFFTSDQLSAYESALLHTYGQWVQPERNGNRVPVAFLDNLKQIETLFPPLDDFDPSEPAVSLD
jgi:IS1 family transposase